MNKNKAFEDLSPWILVCTPEAPKSSWNKKSKNGKSCQSQTNTIENGGLTELAYDLNASMGKIFVYSCALLNLCQAFPLFAWLCVSLRLMCCTLTHDPHWPSLDPDLTLTPASQLRCHMVYPDANRSHVTVFFVPQNMYSRTDYSGKVTVTGGSRTSQ